MGDLLIVGTNSMWGQPPRLTTTPSGGVAVVGAGGSASFNDAGLLGADPSATAAVNTAAIQSALNAYGIVTLLTPGVFDVTGALIIKSNTKLVLGANTTIRLASGSNTNILVSNAYQAAATNVTMSWSSGLNASVGWTAHGKTAGDFVSIFGVAQSQFIGVFQIASVTDADNFVVTLRRLPTTSPTATGASIQAKAADTNISIEGGTFDYDVASNSGATVLDAHALILGHIAHLKVDTKIRRASKFCMSLGALYDYDVRVETDDTNSDVIKGYGPLFFGKVMAIGPAGDDLVTLQTKEPAAYASYRWSYGDIIDAEINSDGTSPYALAGLYLSQNEFADNVRFGAIDGLSQINAIKLAGDSVVGSANGGHFGTVTISKAVRGASASTWLSPSYCTGVLLRVEEGCTPNVTGTTQSAIAMSSTVTLNVLNISYMQANLAAYTGVAVQISGSTIGKMIIGGDWVNGVPCQIDTSATVKEIHCINNYTHGGAYNSRLLAINSTANKPTINLHGNYFNSLAAIIAANPLGVNVNASNNYCYNMSQGFVRGNYAAQPITIRGSSNTLDGTSITFSRAVGSEVVSLFSSDLPADLTTLARTAGSMCIASANTGAGGATDILANNVCVCDATAAAGSWKQLSNPATRVY